MGISKEIFRRRVRIALRKAPLNLALRDKEPDNEKVARYRDEVVNSFVDDYREMTDQEIGIVNEELEALGIPSLDKMVDSLNRTWQQGTGRKEELV
jgi:hypothetical protein